MSLHHFFNFNYRCPICNNKLTLYMQWIDSHLFVASNEESGTYYFTKYKNKEIDLGLNSNEDDSYMTLLDYGDKIETSFSYPSLFNDAKKYQIYFYFLCNSAGFRSTGLKNYEINLVRGCYYRSTPIMEFVKQENGNWELEFSIKEFSDLIYKDESFCLKNRKEGLDKFYLLSRDMEAQLTKVWFFAMTDAQRADKNFKPSIFRKELPLINRPTFTNHKKIIERIDNWILIS